MSKWFEADKDGLRQIAERLVERRGFGIIGSELYQNVRDTEATECLMSIEKVNGHPLACLTVTDNDPTGFTDLTHAWTLFAPSLKKADPTKAGRFNVGEKYVLSFCTDARISTTKGTVEFTAEGRFEYPRRKREFGTEFKATIQCTTERLEQLVGHMRGVIVKPGLKLIVNGEEIPHRQPIATFVETLPTEIQRGDGSLGHSLRQTEIEIYDVAPDETAMLFELGIPVVETGDKWHINVSQKIPLNVDRDNVTPAYLRDVRTFVMNHMHEWISEDDTEESWVNEATSSEKCSPDAVETFRVKKYGDRSVAEDPFNPEANAEAMANGFTVIPSHGLSKGQRDNLKKNGFLQSSTQRFPTAGKGAYSEDSETPVKYLEDEELSPGMKLIREYTQGLATKLLGKKVNIQFVKLTNRECGGVPWLACYGRGLALARSEFHYNIGILGRRWFENGVIEAVDDLILHEFGHETCGNHLERAYHDALTKLGARLKRLALEEPDWFRQFQK